MLGDRLLSGHVVESVHLLGEFKNHTDIRKENKKYLDNAMVLKNTVV